MVASSAARLVTNFESEQPSSYYAELYKRDQLDGGHVIMLGAGADSRQGTAPTECSQLHVQPTFTAIPAL
jgi:hypothetical protein